MFVYYFKCYCGLMLRAEESRIVQCSCSWRHRYDKKTRTSTREWTATYWNWFGGACYGIDKHYEDVRYMSYK